MKKETMVILAILVAVVVVVFLLIQPAIDDAKKASSYLSEQEARLKEFVDIANKIKDLNQKYEGNTEELEKIISVLPKEQELAALLIQLENLASANGLIMESIDFVQKQTAGQKVVVPKISIQTEELFPQSTGQSGGLSPSGTSSESQPPYKTLAVTLKLSGGYNSFKNYLQSVEKNLRLMDVNNLTFSSAGQESISSAFNFTIGIDVYYQ